MAFATVQDIEIPAFVEWVYSAKCHQIKEKMAGTVSVPLSAPPSVYYVHLRTRIHLSYLLWVLSLFLSLPPTVYTMYTCVHGCIYHIFDACMYHILCVS